MPWLRFRVTVVWLPFLLGCFFTLCESQSAGGGSVFSNSRQTYSDSANQQSDESILSQPGVVVGIIVGVAGVLVVVGVTILLCRLFCCKQSNACCCCCCPCCCKGEEEESYLEAGTVPIKIPSTQDSPPDNNRARPRTTETRRKTRGDSSANPPKYDDVPGTGEWNLDDMIKNEQIRASDGDGDEGSHDSFRPEHPSEESVSTFPPAEETETAANGFSSSGTKRSKTPTRRKLMYGAENPDASPDSGDPPPGERPRPKKRNVDVPRHGREFPITGLNLRRENLTPALQEEEGEEEAGVGGVVVERDAADEVSGGREFPLLEYEPRTRTFGYGPPYGDESSHACEETGGGRGKGFRTAGHEHQNRYLPNSYTDHTSSRTMWGEDRRPKERREVLASHAAVSASAAAAAAAAAASAARAAAESTSNAYPASHSVQFISGRVNPAFNQDSTETSLSLTLSTAGSTLFFRCCFQGRKHDGFERWENSLCTCLETNMHGVCN